MSRKHNAKHNRTRSRYPRRLEARGLGKAPKMPRLDSLQRQHATRIKETGSPWPAAGSAEPEEDAA